MSSAASSGAVVFLSRGKTVRAAAALLLLALGAVPGQAEAPGAGHAAATAAATAAGQAAAPAAAPAAPAPLTLPRAVELALGSAHEVAAAAAAVAGDQAAARLAADAMRLGSEVSTTPGVGRGLPVAVAGRVPAVVSVDVHQSVYNNELRSQALAARAKTPGTLAAFQRSRTQVAREVAELYARCWTDQELLAGAERRLAAAAAIARRAAALHAEARATDLDLAQARLREAKARLRRMEVAASRDADLWELRRRLGLDAGSPVALPEDLLAGSPAGPAAGGLEAALAADPELRAGARSLELLERARRLRLGIFSQVTVDAQAQYSRLSRANGIDQFYVKFREDDWSVALAVTVPLWSGGRVRDGLAQAGAAIDRQKEQQRARAAQIEIEVHRAEAAVEQAQAAVAVAREAAAVAEEDLRIQGALAAEGRANPDDLDSREAALADAREEEIKATANLLTARVQLLAARGELLDDLGLAEPGPTPPAPVAPPAPAAQASQPPLLAARP